MIEIFVASIIGFAVLAVGGGFIYYSHNSVSRPGSTKTLKFKFQYDVVYVNLIEDENGNRTMTHTSSTNWSKEQIYLKIERQRTGVYNQILKWMSYDTDHYPDVSDVYGVCYE